MTITEEELARMEVQHMAQNELFTWQQINDLLAEVRRLREEIEHLLRHHSICAYRGADPVTSYKQLEAKIEEQAKEIGDLEAEVSSYRERHGPLP